MELGSVTALWALGLGLLAVLYSVWPVLRGARRGPFAAARAESKEDDVARVAFLARAWSCAAGEIEATAEANQEPGWES
ncbi:MAG: hypothetical protein JSU87_06570 [Gemmatimonadota bacterium]|nr:MAG: hypothetical protein JSU87_06570 [Gemmatimonadota bacterium]